MSSFSANLPKGTPFRSRNRRGDPALARRSDVASFEQDVATLSTENLGIQNISTTPRSRVDPGELERGEFLPAFQAQERVDELTPFIRNRISFIQGIQARPGRRQTRSILSGSSARPAPPTVSGVPRTVLGGVS